MGRHGLPHGLQASGPCRNPRSPIGPRGLCIVFLKTKVMGAWCVCHHFSSLLLEASIWTTL